MSTNHKILFGLLSIPIVYFGLFIAWKNIPEEPTQQETPTIQPTTAPQPTKLPLGSYELLERTESKRVENYNVVLGDEKDGRIVALDVKRQCKKDCSVFIYDNERAFQLWQEYNTLTEPTAADTWKKKNYVYVADHLVGQMTFDGSDYQEYPLRDWYYKELKGQ